MGGGCEQAYAAFLEKWGEFMNTDVTEAELNAIKYSGNMNKADMEANGYTKWKWGYKAPRQLMFDKAIMGEYFHIYRSFWRSHMCAVDGTPRLLVCPDECDPAFTPFEECTCEVSALLNGKTTWQNLFPCVLSTTENQNDFLAIMPEDLVVDMMTMLATSSVVEGDMIESSSPQDPLFWMIHTVIERMLSAKVLSLPLLDPCNHRRSQPPPLAYPPFACLVSACPRSPRWARRRCTSGRTWAARASTGWRTPTTTWASTRPPCTASLTPAWGTRRRTKCCRRLSRYR